MCSLPTLSGGVCDGAGLGMGTHGVGVVAHVGTSVTVLSMFVRGVLHARRSVVIALRCQNTMFLAQVGLFVGVFEQQWCLLFVTRVAGVIILPTNAQFSGWTPHTGCDSLTSLPFASSLPPAPSFNNSAKASDAVVDVKSGTSLHKATHNSQCVELC